jgi:hypothetical protein
MFPGTFFEYTGNRPAYSERHFRRYRISVGNAPDAVSPE